MGEPRAGATSDDAGVTFVIVARVPLEARAAFARYEARVLPCFPSSAAGWSGAW